MASAKKKITINVSQGDFYKIITDYNSYPKFLSTVRRVKIRERSKDTAIVEFEAKVVKTFRYVLELTGTKDSGLRWKLVEGEFMRKNEGRWILKVKSKNCIEATYSISVELGRLVPGFVAKLLVEESLPKTLEEFKKRAETLAEKPGPTKKQSTN